MERRQLFTCSNSIYICTTVFGVSIIRNFGFFLIWWSRFCGYWGLSGFMVLGPCLLVSILIFMFWIFFMRDSILSRCLLILELYLFSTICLFFPAVMFVLVVCWLVLLCPISVPRWIFFPLTFVVSKLIFAERTIGSELQVTSF